MFHMLFIIRNLTTFLLTIQWFSWYKVRVPSRFKSCFPLKSNIYLQNYLSFSHLFVYNVHLFFYLHQVLYLFQFLHKVFCPWYHTQPSVPFGTLLCNKKSLQNPFLSLARTSAMKRKGQQLEHRIRKPANKRDQKL